MIRAAAELGVLRSQTQRLFRSLQPADYPGFIETAAMSSLTHEGSSGLLPYSWAAMAAFGSLLRVMEGDNLLVLSEQNNEGILPQ